MCTYWDQQVNGMQNWTQEPKGAVAEEKEHGVKFLRIRWIEETVIPDRESMQARELLGCAWWHDKDVNGWAAWEIDKCERDKYL